MSTYTAHPQNEAQDAAMRAFLEALGIPYHSVASEDETAHLLSTEANRERLLDAIANEGKESRTVSLDEIWK